MSAEGMALFLLTSTVWCEVRVRVCWTRFGANVDFPKYFEKYDSLVRKEKFPEIYHTCVDANDTDA